MENAVDALKIAFAVFVLVLALTVSIISFNNAKATSDVILYTKDETNYYEYQVATGKASENRIVGIETIIPTLFRYYKENFTVVFKSGNYNTTTGQFSNVKYLPIYKSLSNQSLWQDSYVNEKNPTQGLMYKKYGIKSKSSDIFSFDLDEETLRHEPWTGSNDKIKSNLDAFLNGSVYISPVDNKEYKNYGKDTHIYGGFIQKYKNSKFVETTGEYVYSTDEKLSDIANATKEKTKRVITYTLIK